jgi:hypothetical protein
MSPNAETLENRRHRVLKRGSAAAVLLIGVAIGIGVPMRRAHVEKETRREQLAASLAEGVRQLEIVQREFAGIEASKRDELSRHVAVTAAQAAGDIAALQKTALSAQRKVVTGLEGALEDLALFSAKRSNVNFDRVYRAHEASTDRQADILTAQQQALGELSLMQPGHPAVVAQQAARQAQIAIGAELAKLAEARDLARGSRLRTPTEREYEHHTYHAERATRRQEQIPRDLETMAARIRELAAMQETVTRELAAATDESVRIRLQSQAHTVGVAMADVEKRRSEAGKQLASAASTLAKHAPKVAELEIELASEATPATPEDLKVDELQRRVIGLQREAIRLQDDACAAMKDFRPVADPQSLDDALAVPGTDSVAGSNSDCYQQAAALERGLRNRFRKIQAMDLAMTRRLPLVEAMASMEPAPLPRPELSKPDDCAKAEIDSMVNGAQAMLDQARRLVVGKEAPVQRGEILERMESLATADREDPARDLTGVPAGKDGSTPRLLPGGPGGPPALDVKTASFPAFSLLSHRELSPPPDWYFVDQWQVLGPFDNPERMNIDTRFAPESLVDLTATYPGKNDVPIRWEKVESATPNVMPPFSDYNRTRKIDGLDEQTAYRSNLRYTIYYAYAELHFEQDCDRWLAIGSDDYSKIWINGQPVWSSVKDAKAWKADEGYRKVHFKAGVNRVLYRVENGNDRTEFSLLIGMQP